MNALILAALVFTLPAKDEEAIRAMFAAVDTGFNNGDGKAVAAAFTEDGTVVEPMGETLKGRAAIEAHVNRMAAGHMKGTTHRTTVKEMSSIKPDVALVDADVVISGMKSPQGQPLPPMNAFCSVVAVKQKGKWLAQ